MSQESNMSVITDSEVNVSTTTKERKKTADVWKVRIQFRTPLKKERR